MYRPVQNQQGYFSMHATKKINQGDTITEVGILEELESPTKFSVQVSKKRHILMDPDDLKTANHSCDPTIFVDMEQMKFIALKDLEQGDQITFFYPASEWDMSSKFECGCGSVNCLGLIGGASSISPQVLKSYKLNKHIIELLNEHQQ